MGKSAPSRPRAARAGRGAALLLLLLPGCIGPGGWDGYADGARYDPASNECVWTGLGQPGVVDLRSRAQRGIGLHVAR